VEVVVGGQMVAAAAFQRERKVRASQSRVVGNADPSKDEGKCHRKQTAERSRLREAW
jgi:hypothetical protein